jgi:hypothetical protein
MIWLRLTLSGPQDELILHCKTQCRSTRLLSIWFCFSYNGNTLPRVSSLLGQLLPLVLCFCFKIPNPYRRDTTTRTLCSRNDECSTIMTVQASRSSAFPIHFAPQACCFLRSLRLEACPSFSMAALVFEEAKIRRLIEFESSQQTTDR